MNIRAYHELNSENLDRILDAYYLKPRPVIEDMCTAAGFSILKSWEVYRSDRELDNGESLCSFLWVTTNGAFDPSLVTEERLESFCGRYSDGKNAPITFFADEGDSHCALIAAKALKQQ